MAATPTERSEIVSLVGEAHAALASIALGPLSDLLLFKTVDVGRAVYLSETEATDDERQFFADIMSSAEWTVEGWDAEMAAVEIVGHGHVALVSRPGAQPALSVDMGDAELAIPVYVARVGGALRIVR